MRRVKRLALLLCLLGALLITTGTVFARKFPLTAGNDTVSSETLYFDNVRELIAISGTLPINVELSESDICEVSYTSDLPVISSIDEYGVLRLTQDDSFSFSLLSARRHSFHLTVKLPERSYRRISLSTSSGDISCGEVSCDSLELSTRSGAITAIGTDGGTQIRTESGTVDMSVSSLESDMTVNAGTGEVRLTVPEEMPVCVMFLTRGGSFYFPEAKEIYKGDRAIVRNNGSCKLTVITTGGDLSLAYEYKDQEE